MSANSYDVIFLSTLELRLLKLFAILLFGDRLLFWALSMYNITT